MGTVYLGTHVETGQQAAIKILPPSMAREEGFVARFVREIDAMKHLQSPHIVELYESGEDLGTYYYAMEYVAGENLTDRLKREKRIPWQEAIAIAVQVCKALKSAHNAGIVHRDLKPSNLLLTPDGTVKLSDFGIAQIFASSRLTITGGILGTAEFMSPEQAQGRRATKQSDIYSLGAVMYVMLTGRPPFTGKTTLDIIQKHKFSQFDSPKRLVPEVPFWLDEVVCQCLAKKPEERYPDAYVLQLRLQEIVKKLELKNSDLPDEGNPPPEGVTVAETTEGEVGHHVGSTVARDLFRIQMETDSKPSLVARWLDDVWFLAALLVLLVLGTLVMLKWRTPRPEQLFAQGQKLLQQPEGPDWETAREKYFQPLVELDPETWAPQVDPYLARIQLYDLKRKLLGRALNRDPTPRSEPETILRRVLDLRQQGRTSEALQKLDALEILIQDQHDWNSLVTVIKRLRDEISEQEVSSRFDYISAALKRAGELLQSGKKAEARSIWHSIIVLYADTPGAAEYVDQARQFLVEKITPEQNVPSDAF